MVILRATSNLGGQKEDKGMMCSITLISISLVTMIILKKKKNRVKRDKDYHIYKKEKKNKVVGLLEKKDE
jgi:prolipoprotein diacylglyceryltransferase